MLTIFSTAKPFQGHSAIIQRNALESWRRLDPDMEIILLGDDTGTAELCSELHLRYEPHIERKENGTKTVRSVFEQAQQIAHHDFVCYCNCDIILTADFARAFQTVRAKFRKFLMVGRRWDLDVTQPLDFSQPDWQNRLVDRARREGFQRLHYNIDYFVFPRGLYAEFPDLVIGRNYWDQWLVWKAAAKGLPVIDASDAVCAVHQNHDYAYHPQGMTGVWNDEATKANFRAAGGRRHLRTIEDATYFLGPAGIRPNCFYWLAPAKRRVRAARHALRTFVRTRLWHPLLNVTRSLRQALGLRKESLDPLRRQKAPRRHWLDQ
ncbi:MAG TPA: hypothetical protein VJN89_19915 [Candidatus Acidoferrum sp.]|nr:hypothetical protein [Candidatus Acidoferrum sp.]